MIIIKKLLILFLMLSLILTGCSFKKDILNIGKKIESSVELSKDRKEYQEDIREDLLQDIEEVYLDMNVADIEIHKGSNNKILGIKRIRTDKLTEKEVDMILKDYKIDIKIKDKRLIVKDNAKEIKKKYKKLDNNFELYMNLGFSFFDDIKNTKIELDVGDVKIEELTSNISIDLNVGDLKLNKIKGSFDIKTDVGDIDLENATVVKHMMIKSNVGDVKLAIKGSNNIDRGTVIVDVGDIDILKTDYDFKLKTANKMLRDKGTFTLEVKTRVGDISIK